ncbi:MAG: glycosyltransferase [Proteobacteria bacterium]|nr:glycosyltransferase [Pseudomonadota bacterium]
MNAANVTALVATCNRANFLREALDSILGQTVPPGQVIVVNDGSTDGTTEVLRGYGERIEVMEQENGGKSHALNRAMARVRGEHLWIFDDDDIALPTNLERHLSVLDAHPGAGFVYSTCRIIRSEPDGRVEYRGRMEMPDVPEGEIFPRMLESNFMQQQAMLVRTRCYREVGPFDVDLDRGQDYEMNLRLARRFPGKHLDAESFLFRHHDGPRGRPSTLFSSKDRRRRWVTGNREILRNLCPGVGLAEYLPRGLTGDPLDVLLRRRALLQRACIMARCGLWEEALVDFREALVDTLPGAPLGPVEQGLCRRALSKYIEYDVAIEGLLDNPSVARRFERLIDESRNADARRIFGSQLARYAWRRLRRRNPVRAVTALALGRRIAGLRSWVPEPLPARP